MGEEVCVVLLGTSCVARELLGPNNTQAKSLFLDLFVL